MNILVTAFGPFGGRSENASMLALRELKKSFPTIRTRILPVDSVIAPKRLKQAMESIRPDALIMLGEAGGSKKIRLETTAWNELDFRIPDINGRQPQGKLIRPGAVGSLSSTLPLQKFHALLDASDQQVSFSEDPGRYLCNQIFYTALTVIMEKERQCVAGFIHLPLESDYPTGRSVAAIGRMIEELNSSQASGS